MSKSKYIFIVSMNVKPEYENLFNEVYDKEHIPYLLEVLVGVIFRVALLKLFINRFISYLNYQILLKFILRMIIMASQ